MKTAIQITRTKGYADFFRKYAIWLDSEKIGTITRGAQFSGEIAPGKHTIRMSVDWCGSKELEFEVKEGETINIQCGSNLRGWKIVQAFNMARKSPNDWIWLKIV